MKKVNLEREDISVVKISDDVMMEILKEYLFEHCCEISGINNKLEDVVSSVLFKNDANGISTYLLVANDEDMQGMNRIDFSAEDVAKLNLKDGTPIRYNYNDLKKKIGD